MQQSINSTDAGLGQPQGLAGWTNLPYLRPLDRRYLEWNAAIANALLEASNRDRRVLFYVDQERINEIGERLNVPDGNAYEDFINAVRRTASGATPFLLHNQKLSRWTAQIEQGRIVKDSPPPFLGILAMFVLAASQMQRDASLQVSQQNYYVRLRSLLGMPAVPIGQPRGFSEFSERAWTALDKWTIVTNRGCFGLVPDRPNPRVPFVSRPMNQCVMRAGDRSRLGEFFDWGGWVNIDELPTRDELIDLLRKWASSGAHLSAHGIQQLSDDDAAMIIADITLDDFEYRAAVGSPPSPTSPSETSGTRPGKIVLQFIPARNGTASWKFQPKACNVSVATVASGPDGDVLLKPMNDHWLEPLYGLQVKAYLEQQRSFELRTETVTFCWRYQEIHVLAGGDGNNGAKGEIGQNRVKLGVPCTVLFRQSSRRIVMEVLEQSTDGHYRERPPAMAPCEGWSLVSNVVFVKIYDGSDVPECLIPRRPSGNMVLFGGIKLNARDYLEGYPPSALITPAAGDERSLRVNAVQVPDQDFSGPVTLAPYLRGGANTLETPSNLTLIRIIEYSTRCPVIDDGLAFRLTYQHGRAFLKDSVLERVHLGTSGAGGDRLIHVSGARITRPDAPVISPVPLTQDGTSVATNPPKMISPTNTHTVRQPRQGTVFTFPQQFNSLIVVGNLPGEYMRVLLGKIHGYVYEDDGCYPHEKMMIKLRFVPQFSWNGLHAERHSETILAPELPDQYWPVPNGNDVLAWATACMNIGPRILAAVPEAAAYRARGREIVELSRR